MVDLALLGCGGGMPIPERFLSSLLIKYKGRKILIDCGEGTQVSMRLLGWGFKSVDMICITHGHGDHVVGLPGLLATIGNSGRVEPITIIGPYGISDLVKGLRTACPFLPYCINIIENPKEPIEISDLKISFLELAHGVPCLGYSFYFKRKRKFEPARAEENEIPKIFWNNLQNNETVEYKGKTYLPSMVLGEERKGIKLSFITDTRSVSKIIPFIANSDLFICEGTYGNDEDIEKAENYMHMTFSQAAELALLGEADELLLTHFSPSMLNPEEFKGKASEIFENTTIGYDRLIKTLSFIK